MVCIRIGPKRLPLGEAGTAQAVTDEGQKAPNICTAVSLVLPAPHPAPRATFPQGKAFLVQICQLSRERSKKTEGVFLGAPRGSGGKFAIPPGSFSFASVFFWRSKRKCWIAVANLQKSISLIKAFIFPVPSSKQPAAGESGDFQKKIRSFLHIVYKSFTILKKKGSIISIFKYERK